MRKHVLFNPKKIQVLRRLICTGLMLFAVTAQAIELGALSFANPSAEFAYNPNRLSLPQNRESGIGGRGGNALRGIGGVNFQHYATPDSGIVVSKLQFLYDSLAEDTYRLRALINADTVQLAIPDWQWVPIARYADTDNYACFTLFGSLKNKTMHDSIMAANKGKTRPDRILNYHPAFENTLLGLRLFQMDILILDTNATYLPTHNGTVLLGTGESVPDHQSSKRAFMTFNNRLAQWIKREGQSFQSYMITDFPLDQIRFSYPNRVLEITQNPWFYLWTMKINRPGFDVNQIRRQEADALIDQSPWYRRVDSLQVQVLNNDSAAAENRRLLLELYAQLQEEGITIPEQVHTLLFPQDSTDVHGTLMRYDQGSIVETIAQLRADIEAQTPVQLAHLSDSVSLNRALIREINPLVWDATVQTMRYAAFFRYCRKNHPQAWSSLLAIANTIIPQPRVQTPTLMRGASRD